MKTVADAFRANERLLWGLGYRMTGLASDADEIVQETFLRALEHPLPDDGRPMRPWLVRVCINLARDRLRARRRRGGEIRSGNGAWLPSPVPSEHFLPEGGRDAEARYHRAETAGLAFVLALEALTPTQRAVLLLRDVFELDADEVAVALGTTAGAVRVSHHRARRALEAHAAAPGAAPAVTPTDTTLAALGTFLGALASGDAAAALAVLAPDVVLRSDGGNVYFAAKVPVFGAEKVLRFLLHVTGFSAGASSDSARAPVEARWEFRSLNGEPMVVIESAATSPRRAPRFVVGVSLGATGRIVAIHWVLDPAKLRHVAPLSDAPLSDAAAAPGTTGQTAPPPR